MMKCKCGEQMFGLNNYEFSGDYEPWGVHWYCLRRRLWNFWKHPNVTERTRRLS